MLCELNINELSKQPLKQLAQSLNEKYLRWGGVALEEGKIIFEALTHYSSPVQEESIQVLKKSPEEIGIFCVPTGLGCSIGGFGGDAGLHAQLLANQVDLLIVNPNVVNGGSWINLPSNALYVEGLALDLFCLGQIALRRVKQNKVGVIFDSGMSQSLIQREVNVIRAAQTINGIDSVGYCLTDEAVIKTIVSDERGFSSGSIQNPQTLLRAADELIKKGVEAIVVVCSFDNEENESQYLQGISADPIGGLEALISRAISFHTQLPCAHAPHFTANDTNTPEIDSRVCPETTSFSFLPSVLKGLSKAPQLIPITQMQNGDLNLRNINYLIYPADCCFGSPFLSLAEEKEVKKYTLKSCRSNKNLTPSILGIRAEEANNIFELVGKIQAHKLGIKITNP
jgi:hypothetical protein